MNFPLFESLRNIFHRIISAIEQKKIAAEAAMEQRRIAAEAEFQSRVADAAERFVLGRGVDFHCSDDQYARFKRACDPIYSGRIVSIDKQHLSYKIRSNSDHISIYQTNLEKCTCPDFSKRKRPCKHMYKLALELGVITSDWDLTGIPSNLKTTIDSLDLIDQIAFLELIQNHRHSYSFEGKKKFVPTSLIENELVIPMNDFSQILDEKYSKNDIIAALATRKNAYRPTSKSTKREMISWIVDNDGALLRKLCNKYSYFRFSPAVQGCTHYIYREYKHLLG